MEKAIYNNLHELIRLNYVYKHKKFEAIGLYPGQPPVLMIVEKHKSINQKAIADQMNISQATLTTTLKRMEKVGLIKRERSEVDSRKILVSITDEGIKKHKEFKIVLKEYNCVFKDFTDKDFKNLNYLLSLMKKNILNELNIDSIEEIINIKGETK